MKRTTTPPSALNAAPFAVEGRGLEKQDTKMAASSDFINRF